MKGEATQYEYLIRDARAAIDQAFADGRAVFLAYGGGKEAAVLAHLCQQFRGRFRLLWANTGFMFPHVETFIRKAGEEFGLVELKSDLLGHWKAYGLPTEILPVSNALGDNCHIEPKLQPWVSCCQTLRGAPIATFIQSLNAPATIIQGQRKEDKAPGLGLAAARFWNGSSVVSPLADWTTADVMQFIADEGIVLPEHYDRVADSLDCWACPASFVSDYGSQLADYMGERYPDLLRIVLPGLRKIHAASAQATNQLGDILDRTQPQPTTVDFVPQRTVGIGDCVIAAVATATSRSYEDIAAALGFPCDVDTGLPSLPAGRGIALQELVAPLIGLGISTSLLVTPELLHFDVANDNTKAWNLPSPDELKTLIRNRTAVLTVFDGVNGDLHAFAWRDGKVIDCRADNPLHARIEDVTVLGCALFTFGETVGRDARDMVSHPPFNSTPPAGRAL